MERAKCREIDLPLKERLQLFFPYRGASRTKAKACCAVCPVKAECEAYAEKTRSVGIWAGEVRTMYERKN